MKIPKTLFLSACLAIFLTRIFWYDLRVVFESARQDGLGTMFVVYAAALAPFILGAFTLGVWSVLRSRLLLFYIFLMVFGLATAVYHRRVDSLYVYQDLFKLSFVPTTAVLVAFARPALSCATLERVAAFALVLLFGKFTASALYSSRGLYYGTAADLFPFCVFAAMFACKKSNRNLRTAILSAVSLGLVVLGKKRTLAVSLVFTIAFLFQRSLRQNRWAFPILGVICAIFVLGVSIARSTPVEEMLFSRLSAPGANVEESTRGEEIRRVYETLRDHSGVAVITGFGHGATFKIGSDKKASKSSDAKHSVHFTPAAMHLRYGLLGWVLLVWTGWAAIRGGAHMLPQDLIPFSVALRAYAIAASVASLGMFGLIDDMVVGAAIGLTIETESIAPPRSVTTKPFCSSFIL